MHTISKICLFGIFLSPVLVYAAPAAAAEGAVALPGVVGPSSKAGSIENSAIQHFHGRVVFSGTVSWAFGQPPRHGAHVDVALRDSRGKILAVLTDDVSFNRHPVSARQRRSRFTVSWPSGRYPTASIAEVRYVAHSHSSCDDEGRKR